ncbi:MAG: hypothetical protein ACK5CE_17300 [Actinomycetes bacterium]
MSDSLSPVIVILVVVAVVVTGIGTMISARTRPSSTAPAHQRASSSETSGTSGPSGPSGPSETSGRPEQRTSTPDVDPTPTRMSVPHPDTPPPVSDDPTRVPAGWYPVLGGGTRYWDGERWTDHHAA